MAPEVLRAGPGDYGAEADWCPGPPRRIAIHQASSARGQIDKKRGENKNKFENVVDKKGLNVSIKSKVHPAHVRRPRACVRGGLSFSFLPPF